MSWTNALLGVTVILIAVDTWVTLRWMRIAERAEKQLVANQVLIDELIANQKVIDAGRAVERGDAP